MIDHDQNSSLCMLAALHVTKNHETQSVLDQTVHGTVDTGRVNVEGARVQQEDVGFGTVGNVVHVAEDISTHTLGVGHHNESRVHVDGSGTLFRVSGVLYV